jgi:DNA (cytosine-5)-methyltransferase 1
LSLAKSPLRDMNRPQSSPVPRGDVEGDTLKKSVLGKMKRTTRKTNKCPVVAVDIFCGVGGLTYGLNRAGIKVVAGVDVDDRCQFAFEKNNNALFIHKSIKEIKAKEIIKLYPPHSLKVLAGCAPCQPFSKHTHKDKNRETKDDWGLLYHFLKLIKKVKPLVVSMENVPQITKHEVFADFVEGLRAKKYSVSWQTVNCPDYGIPQNRRRLVLLASKLGEIELIPPTHKPKNYKTVKMAIGNLEPIEAGKSSRKDRLHKAAALAGVNLKRIIKSAPGSSWLDWDEDLRADCHRKKSGATYRSVYSRMEWNKPSPTITTQFFSFGTGRFGHPEQNRAISIREGAIFQTFPQKYKFMPSAVPVEFKKLGRYIGNAVPVRLGAIIGKSIIRHLRVHYE